MPEYRRSRSDGRVIYTIYICPCPPDSSGLTPPQSSIAAAFGSFNAPSPHVHPSSFRDGTVRRIESAAPPALFSTMRTQGHSQRSTMEEERDGGHGAWGVHMVTATPATIKLWRVIGDELDVAAYAAAHTSSTPSATPGDWSAMYFQLSAGNAAGTLGYRWDQGCTVARLMQVSMPLAEIGAVALVVDDAGKGTETDTGTETGPQQRHGLMVAHDVSGAFKAAQLKLPLGIPADKPLLPALGQRQPPAVLVCRESVGEWEVAVPHNLLPLMTWGAEWAERCVAEFRPRAGVTAETRPCEAAGGGEEGGQGAGGGWRRWRDGDAVVAAGKGTELEALPRWLSDALAGRAAAG